MPSVILKTTFTVDYYTKPFDSKDNYVLKQRSNNNIFFKGKKYNKIKESKEIRQLRQDKTTNYPFCRSQLVVETF